MKRSDCFFDPRHLAGDDLLTQRDHRLPVGTTNTTCLPSLAFKAMT